MMNEDKQKQVLEAARQSLDKSVGDLPDELSNALTAARQRALASPELGSGATNSPLTDGPVIDGPVTDGPRLIRTMGHNRLIWSGAIAASCAALTLSFVLRQPGTGPDILPLDSEDSMLVLTEMDETEWALVQELEFALWLSEFGDDASATDFSG